MKIDEGLESIEAREPQLQMLRQLLVRRQMLEPVLLFLAGHRPLAFVVGHLVLLLAPLGDMMGWSKMRPLAGALIEPGAAARLETMLRKDIEYS